MRARRYVVSDASPDDATACSFLHFWTPNGLTTGDTRRVVEMAKRAGWDDTIVVTARSRAEATAKAVAAFTTRRGRA